MSAPPGASSPPGPPSGPPSGPPYPPQGARLGGLPTPNPDDIICGVLMLFFLAGAITNMTIFRLNMKRGHKFVFSAMLFGFCMVRMNALIMRVVWASYPTNVSIAIAAAIFTAAGVLLLFIINLILTQRIVRARHPDFGWNRTVTMVFRFLMFCVVAMLIMVIVSTVHSFYTLDATAHDMERKVQLFVGTYLALLAFLPIPIVITAALVPRSGPIDKFGKGSHKTQIILVLFTATLLTLGAGFRIGVNFAPRPSNEPGWYHHKAAYYCFNYVIEIICLYTYIIARFDQRFHIPNGSAAPGHYSRTNKSREVSLGSEEASASAGSMQARQWADGAWAELELESSRDTRVYREHEQR